MKIYTKKGDKGVTSLFGGQRVSKSSCRIAAYGTVDELNSYIGLVRSYDLSHKGSTILQHIQDHLFVLGSDLATPMDRETRIERIGEEEVKFLENVIDELQAELPELKHFILPGGCPAGSTLHICRTVCRRAERRCVECLENEELSPLALKYLNRLSDFLFVAARYENQEAGILEHKWQPR